MSATETPAGHLARLQVSYPAWRITKNIPGVAPPGFTAVERATGKQVIASTPGEKEAALINEGGERQRSRQARCP